MQLSEHVSIFASIANVLLDAVHTSGVTGRYILCHTALDAHQLLQDVDSTCSAGILRRVLLLIVIGTVGGTALFFLGLKFAFPEYR